MKNILIIQGHPDKKSFNYALSDTYAEGLKKSNVSIEWIYIADLDFNPSLQYGYRRRTDLEDDLRTALDKIKRADHITWFFPIWWAGFPAIMKGFIDRLFLPGIAFNFIEGKAFQQKLWKGKTARMIITSDSPRWYDYLYMKSPAVNQLKKGVLEFCGISPVATSYFSTVKNSSSKKRENWLQKVYQLGVHAK